MTKSGHAAQTGWVVFRECPDVSVFPMRRGLVGPYPFTDTGESIETIWQSLMPERSGSFAYLPAELEYLIEPAMTYGVLQFDDDVDRFLERATEEDLESLARVAECIHLNHHDDLIGSFLDDYPITEYSESANLYFLLGVIDAADVSPEDDSWNTVENRINSLQKHGSFRLASERMWAARFLADFGADAMVSIPHLERALEDDDQRVQVWAHYALAILKGERYKHEQAIRAILAQHSVRDEMDLLDDVGSEAEAALEKLAE